MIHGVEEVVEDRHLGCETFDVIEDVDAEVGGTCSISMIEFRLSKV